MRLILVFLVTGIGMIACGAATLFMLRRYGKDAVAGRHTIGWPFGRKAKW